MDKALTKSRTKSLLILVEVESSFCDLSGAYKEASLSQRRKPQTFLSLVAFILQAICNRYYKDPGSLKCFLGETPSAPKLRVISLAS